MRFRNVLRVCAGFAIIGILSARLLGAGHEVLPADSHTSAVGAIMLTVGLGVFALWPSRSRPVRR